MIALIADRHKPLVLFETVFKLDFKLVLFSKTLEGCYSMSNGHAAFNLSLNLSYLVKLWKAATPCLMVMQPSNLSLTCLI